MVFLWLSITALLAVAAMVLVNLRLFINVKKANYEKFQGVVAKANQIGPLTSSDAVVVV